MSDPRHKWQNVAMVTEHIDYSPFITEGFVSFVGDVKKVSVRILRDTGACVSFISEKILPFNDASNTGTSVLICGIGLNSFSVPIHKIHLSSALVDGVVNVGVRPTLPIDGVDVLLCNNLAGDRVWPEPVPPVVKTCPVPNTQQEDCSTASPEVFTACAITRAMSKNLTPSSSSGGKVYVPVLPPSLSCEELNRTQKEDQSLSFLFERVSSCSYAEYDIDQDDLLCKCSSPGKSDVAGPVTQVVVPLGYRDVVLKTAHGEAAGHFGISKTCRRIREHFFLASDETRRG